MIASNNISMLYSTHHAHATPFSPYVNTIENNNNNLLENL